MDTEQANDDGADTTMETSKTESLANGVNGETVPENGSTGNEDNEANKDSGSKEEPMLEDSKNENNENNEAEADKDGDIVLQESNSDGTTMED